MVPVTILTGFLGSGKTTLLNRILTEQHGRRIAVIENEFGEAGVDNEILLQDREEQIIEMNNGCICCTVRGDLVRILGELKDRRERGQLDFERVIIETTGMAQPGPVAQTFIVDDDISKYYLLDSVVTVVDALHGDRQLDEFREAQEQVGFADRVLISKSDLVDSADVERLSARLIRMNPRAPIRRVHFGAAPLDEILDVRGFNLNAILEIDPAFLEARNHSHRDDVTSFVFRSSLPFDGEKLEEFLAAMVQAHGPDMLRYKGVLCLKNNESRVVFQGVHQLMGGDAGRPWASGEQRESIMVFIGRKLPEALFIEGLTQCLVKTS
jgi:G3E family GTPase